MLAACMSKHIQNTKHNRVHVYMYVHADSHSLLRCNTYLTILPLLVRITDSSGLGCSSL